MLLPKKTFVTLAGQNAWHICAGEALPRISGKYLPSQLRTQNAGPEPEATGLGGGAAGWLRPNGSAKKLACGGAGRCCFGAPANRKSNRPSADAACGISAIEAASPAAATSIVWRRLR